VALGQRPFILESFPKGHPIGVIALKKPVRFTLIMLVMTIGIRKQNGSVSRADHHRRSANTFKKSAVNDLVFVQYGDHIRLAASGILTMTLRRWYKKLIRNPDWMSQDTNWRKHQRLLTDAGEASIADMRDENHLTAADYSRRKKTEASSKAARRTDRPQQPQERNPQKLAAADAAPEQQSKSSGESKSGPSQATAAHPLVQLFEHFDR
jgi:hypothetical protein